MLDAHTGRVKIQGFYDDVVPPTRKELQDLKSCGFTVAGFKKDHLFRSLRTNDALDVMKRIWMMPTFEVHGIAGGYQGPGVKTIVPPQGDGHVSCRLVPNMNPRRSSELSRIREGATPTSRCPPSTSCRPTGQATGPTPTPSAPR